MLRGNGLTLRIAAEFWSAIQGMHGALEGRHRQQKVVRTVFVAIIATMRALTLAQGAQAQQTYLNVSAEDDGNPNTNIVSTGSATPITTEQDGPYLDAVGYAIAQYGLIGGSAGAEAGPNQDTQANGTAAFRDLVFFSGSTPMLSVTVTITLIGSEQSLSYPNTDGIAQAQLVAQSYIATPLGTALGTTNYILTNHTGGGVYSVTSSGSLTYTAMVPNNSSEIFLGELSVTAGASDNSSAQATFPSTAVFNITSTDSTATFIGSQQTNYGTIADTGASAPEPSALPLLLTGLGSLTLGFTLRRR